MIEETALLEIDIQSYWHAGTGKGSASYLDAISQTDARGLPFLPGRNLRGLLRHAMEIAEQWGHVERGMAFRLFGGWDSRRIPQERTRFNSQEGALVVENAHLPEAVARWLTDSDERAIYRQALFQPLFSTAVDHGSGRARDGSLRGLQAVVPLTLTAPVFYQGDPSEWRQALILVLPLIRAVGGHRHRGFGRAVLSLKEA
ncbi:MAG: hypothetical protein HQL73_03420 [Magnetococcales bacterium]|nr:hypothetical protein [Magnetococcales bacterium]